MIEKPSPVFGRLEPVALREGWITEWSDFTPWLAQPENIALLGEAIQIELEVESQEKNVGPFRADILCRDTLNGHFVLVENQLERTDHGHLGQLLTYAAGLDAVTIVWIAARFTEEHRAALDWLNNATRPGIDFFGLEIELWRIGLSPIAPKFNVVSKPNDWSKTVKEQAAAVQSTQFTETQQKHLDFWTQLRAYLEANGVHPLPTRPSKDSWSDVPLGRTGFKLSLANNFRDRWSEVGIYFTGPQAKAFYGLVESRYQDRVAATLARFGRVLWEPKPGKQEAAITVQRADLVADPARWPELNAWMKDTLLAMGDLFRPIVKSLDASEWVPPGETSTAEVLT